MFQSRIGDRIVENRVVTFALSMLLALCPWSTILTAQTQNGTKQRSSSVFPIITFASDVGLGLGGKGIVKNQFQQDESFDLILFGSNKGEQWYAFTFSMPDFEIRQGKRYPLALDVKLEYDKILRSNFFGFGNEAKDNEHQFPKESANLELTLGHAFTARVVGELGFRHNHYSVYDFDPAWGTITAATPGAGESRVSLFSARLRWDTRDSQIHPHRGWRLLLASELAAKELGSNWSFNKYRMETSAYFSLWPNHILAGRFWAQQVSGSAPYPELSKIGDSWTVRGYKANRFVDQAMALTSLEYRYPAYKKLGGVLFGDAGHVWSDIWDIGIMGWHANWGLGLRYYLTNFVARFDAGFSTEGMRVFVQFGQVF